MNYRVICDQLKTNDGELHPRGSVVVLECDEERSALSIRAVVLDESQTTPAAPAAAQVVQDAPEVQTDSAAQSDPKAEESGE